MDLLGPDIFSMLRMKGQVLHCEWAHLKVPDWSLVWNELLTKNICGGCFTRFGVIKVLRMIDLTMWSWGWSVRVIGMWWVFSFSAVCSTYCWSIFLAQWWPAWTKETRQSCLSKQLAHYLQFFRKIRVVTV